MIGEMVGNSQTLSIIGYAVAGVLARGWAAAFLTDKSAKPSGCAIACTGGFGRSLLSGRLSSAALLVAIAGLGVGCSLRRFGSHGDGSAGTEVQGDQEVANDRPADGPGGTTGAGGGGPDGGDGGTGGHTGAGGAGTGGASAGGAGGSLVGAGGMTTSCLANSTQCSGDALQTCGNNGQWGVPVACPPRQICTGPVGSASCTCKPDPVCSTVGSTCANPSTLAACSQDALTCFYESSSSLCANGACSGAPGAASCCTNACTNGATQCLSGTSLQTCGVAASGCTAPTSSTCSTGMVCERYAAAACLDPNWAEWPLSNSQVDVTAGAPNPESYTDNGDGTITDNVTKLMWQKAVAPGTFSQANALTYCATTLSGANLGGHNDWRLPSVMELVSIVDFGILPPNINATYFPATPATPADYFASSSAWVVTFYGGGTVVNDFAPLLNVRCVR